MVKQCMPNLVTESIQCHQRQMSDIQKVESRTVSILHLCQFIIHYCAVLWMVLETSDLCRIGRKASVGSNHQIHNEIG